MADTQKVKFNFKEKEGKFFAPLVGRTTRYVNGTKKLVPKSGIKGVYAKVRLSLPVDNATEKTELFAINSEWFLSSR